MQWGAVAILPRPPLPKKGIRRHHFGQHHDIFLLWRPGCGSDPAPHSHLVCRGPRKSRVIPLLTLRVFVAYKKDENLPNIFYNTTSKYINLDTCKVQWKKISTPNNSS